MTAYSVVVEPRRSISLVDVNGDAICVLENVRNEPVQLFVPADQIASENGVPVLARHRLQVAAAVARRVKAP